jgi:hypothetical protein
MTSVVPFTGVTPSRLAVYCVSPARTFWDAKHLNATVIAGSPLETPVLLSPTVTVTQLPRWLAWIAPVAFTIPGHIIIGPDTALIPTELLVHEHVHAARAAQGAAKYWWSVISGWVIGAGRALRFGGTVHQWSPIEIEARAIAQAICVAYEGAPAPIDTALVTAAVNGEVAITRATIARKRPPAKKDATKKTPKKITAKKTSTRRRA